MSDPYAHNPDYTVGREHEREAIVAFLRDGKRLTGAEHLLSQQIARWIERGIHLGSDDA